MEVVFSSGALEEVKEAVEHYEAEVEGLGKAFIQKLDEAIHEIKSFPSSSRIIRTDYRRYLLHRFPYGVIYLIEDDLIFVAAIMHLKRKPFYWTERERKDDGSRIS